MQILQNVNI